MRLPFSIDRASSVKFPHQIADGVRNGIQTGFWKTGERLPGLRELSKTLGVGIRAPMLAMRMLAKEGLIVLREKTGAVVTSERKPLKNGRVLIVCPNGYDVRDATIMSERIRLRLHASRYLVTSVSVMCDGEKGFDFGPLRDELAQYLELVVVFGDEPEITREVAQSEHPYLLVGCKPLRGLRRPVGDIPYRYASAYASFAADVKRAGIKDILVVMSDAGSTDRPVLSATGIRFCSLIVPIRRDMGRAAGLRRSAYEIFERRFRKKNRLPALIVFLDDNLFIGASLAFAAHGIVIPRDVCVTVCTQWDSVPVVLGTTLSRLEWNFRRSGDWRGEAIVGFLSTGVLPPIDGSDMEYIPGGSFPVV